MTVKPRNLKKAVLDAGKKIGVVIEKGSDADQVLTRGSRLAATVVNEGEKQAKTIATELETSFDRLRAKVHKATAPGTKRTRK